MRQLMRVNAVVRTLLAQRRILIQEQEVFAVNNRARVFHRAKCVVRRSNQIELLIRIWSAEIFFESRQDGFCTVQRIFNLIAFALSGQSAQFQRRLPYRVWRDFAKVDNIIWANTKGDEIRGKRTGLRKAMLGPTIIAICNANLWRIGVNNLIGWRRN